MSETIIGIVVIFLASFLLYDSSHEQFLLNIQLKENKKQDMGEAVIIKEKIPVGNYEINDTILDVVRHKTIYYCSHCKKSVTKYYKYCPYCGKAFKGIEEK